MILLLYLALIVVGFYFLIVRPQRRRAAEQRALIAGLKTGDEVITNGGIHGTVRRLDDEVIDLEIAKGVVIKVARGAVAARPLTPEPDDATS
jgi:preprotein translocase subunit YajC